MTDKDYIAENITFGRNVMGWWEATFVCADGYQYHTCDKGNSRSIKGKRIQLRWCGNRTVHRRNRQGKMY